MDKRTPLSNKEVAELLRKMAIAYEILGENRFKINAFHRAAESIEGLPRPIGEIAAEGFGESIPGVGKGMQGYLTELCTTGEVAHFNDVLAQMPKGLFTFLAVPHIGPKTAYRLTSELSISTLEELEAAATDGRIAALPRFGERSAAEILEGIEDLKRREDRVLLSVVLEIAENLRTYLLAIPEVTRVDFLGSLRRMVPTIGDIDIAVQYGGNPQIIQEAVAVYPSVVRVLSSGEKKTMVLLKEGLQVDVRVQPKDSYGAQLQYFTGSKYHNVALRTYALSLGYSVSEYGVTDVKTGKRVACPDEETLYHLLKLDYIPPEMREDRGELALAQAHAIPRLIEESQIKGDLHVHSDFPVSSPLDRSVSTVQEILHAAEERGYEYLGFTDHSPRITTHTEDAILRELEQRRRYLVQHAADSALQVLIGMEVDIFADGSLAFTDRLLHELDYAIVSIHSAHSQAQEVMTERILAALVHPKVHILGHPTGRLLLRREGVEAAWSPIFELCAQRRICIEINSAPERLDLPDTLIPLAREKGVSFCINTDAHAAHALANVRFGVATARRGWVSAEQVVNARPWKAFSHEFIA